VIRKKDNGRPVTWKAKKKAEAPLAGPLREVAEKTKLAPHLPAKPRTGKTKKFCSCALNYFSTRVSSDDEERKN